MADRLYKKLPGRGVQLFAVARLYLGPDHLLKLTTIGGAEEYKRFFYSDIHAIIICRTAGYVWWAVFWGVLAALFMFPAGSELGAGRVTPGLVAWGTIAAFFLFSLVLHLSLGPTCRATIRTAVHTEVLSGVSRTRSAIKLVELLAPRVDSAQAAIAVQEVTVEDSLPSGNSVVTSPEPVRTPAEFRQSQHLPEA